MRVSRGARVTWLGLDSCGGGSVPWQQMHQEFPLPAPHRVQACVGVGEDVVEGAACPSYRPVSVPSPGPGTHAVLAFTPSQPFSWDRINGEAGQITDTAYDQCNRKSPVNLPGCLAFRYQDGVLMCSTLSANWMRSD